MFTRAPPRAHETAAPSILTPLNAHDVVLPVCLRPTGALVLPARLEFVDPPFTRVRAAFDGIRHSWGRLFRFFASI